MPQKVTKDFSSFVFFSFALRSLFSLFLSLSQEQKEREVEINSKKKK